MILVMPNCMNAYGGCMYSNSRDQPGTRATTTADYEVKRQAELDALTCALSPSGDGAVAFDRFPTS